MIWKRTWRHTPLTLPCIMATKANAGMRHSLLWQGTGHYTFNDYVLLWAVEIPYTDKTCSNRISNDQRHGFYGVKVFEEEAFKVLKTKAPSVKTVYRWSNSCAVQYKAKTAFAIISNRGMSTLTENWIELKDAANRRGEKLQESLALHSITYKDLPANQVCDLNTKSLQICFMLIFSWTQRQFHFAFTYIYTTQNLLRIIYCTLNILYIIFLQIIFRVSMYWYASP